MDNQLPRLGYRGRYAAWQKTVTPAICISIERLVDDSPPGFVECRLLDASGDEWVFHEKVHVVSDGYLDARTRYPKPGVIACEIVARRQDDTGREVITVDTQLPWGVESTDGTSRFDITSCQLVDLDG